MSALAGTGALVRLALRRDRAVLPASLLALVGTAAFSASATVDLYPTVEARVRAAQSSNATPALVALYGRIYDQTSIGAISLIKLSSIGTSMVAVLAALLVIRHTRGEEEAGRLELVGATAVGRYGPLTAALVVGAVASLAVGALTALGLVAAGLSTVGSAAFGLSWAATGLAFAGVGAIAAQLTSSTRAAIGIATGAIAATYVVRAVGDVIGHDGPSWLSWLSPIGWAQQVRAYAGDRWVVALLLVALAAVAVAVAGRLASRRDLGAGLWPDRLGPATAGRDLSTSLGLAWRLQRGVLLTYTVAFALLGLVIGATAKGVGDLLDSQAARDLIAKLGGSQTLVDAFLAAELGILGVVASAYTVQAVLRLRSEETSGRAEELLSKGVARRRWASGHVLLAASGAVALMLIVGLTTGATHAIRSHDAAELGRVVAGALVQVPAIWVMVGLTVVAVGVLPRRSVALAWGLLVGFVVLGELGPALGLPGWLMDLSPFGHVPRLPGGSFSVTPVLVLTAIAGVLVAIGLVALDRRDIG